MGNYKAVHKHVDNTKLPRMYPQPDYQIKTRPPVHTGNSWRVNILLRIRQQELSDQSMPYARRKCYDPVMDFAQCQQKQGFFWYVFNCQQQFHYVSQCLQHQYKVQMDKRRRDLIRNPQTWWKQLYDQNGQIGKQAASQQKQIGLLESIKFTLFGDDKFK